MKFGLQLYSIRDSYKTGEEFITALKTVKELGYEGVEFAGYAGLPAEELKNALGEIGLFPIASHEGSVRLENNLSEIVEYNHAIGSRMIVCAGAPTKTKEDLVHLEKILKTAQAEADKYGIKILYHNHSHEFEAMELGFPIDNIKSYCMLEIDTYWVFNSKNDPYSYLKDNAEKIGLVHLKDGGLNSNPCAIGEGQNDIQSILNASSEIGIEWVIVENDDPTPDGLSDVARSMKNIKTKYTIK